MNRPPLAYLIAALVVLAGMSVVAPDHVRAAGDRTLAELSRETHFHGIAVDRANPERFFLATHHGLYVVASDGTARLVSEYRDDFMGFTPHPSDPSRFFASGHPAHGGNLGFITSADSGRTWQKLSDGVGGPVDFHQMDASPSDPRVIYGVYGDLQKSTDGGASWIRVGPAPEGLIDLSVLARDPDMLYAATRRGLLRSADGGRNWTPAHSVTRPATMVQGVADGWTYAFMVGTGLLRARGDDTQWESVSNGFGRSYVLHLSALPGQSGNLYVVTFDPDTRAQAVLVSRDGGRNWRTPGAR